MALFWIVWRELFGQTDAHTDIKIVFICAQVGFLRMSPMIYGSELRDTKTVVRERVNDIT